MAGQYLIALSGRDRAGLLWLRQRASLWLRAMARRRKHLPPGPYSQDEICVGNALIELQKTMAILLGDEVRGGAESPGRTGTPPPILAAGFVPSSAGTRPT